MQLCNKQPSCSLPLNTLSLSGKLIPLVGILSEDLPLKFPVVKLMAINIVTDSKNNSCIPWEVVCFTGDAILEVVTVSSVAIKILCICISMATILRESLSCTDKDEAFVAAL